MPYSWLIISPTSGNSLYLFDILNWGCKYFSESSLKSIFLFLKLRKDKAAFLFSKDKWAIPFNAKKLPTNMWVYAVFVLEFVSLGHLVWILICLINDSIEFEISSSEISLINPFELSFLFLVL